MGEWREFYKNHWRNSSNSWNSRQKKCLPKYLHRYGLHKYRKLRPKERLCGKTNFRFGIAGIWAFTGSLPRTWTSNLSDVKITVFWVYSVRCVHLLYKIGRFSSIPSNKSIISVPTAPKLHPNRKGDSISNPNLTFIEYCGNNETYVQIRILPLIREDICHFN